MSDSEYKDPEWDNSLELKKALKLVLKYEIHCLLRRLSETGEESVVITASAAEGSASHLCSKKGEDFLQIESLDVVKHNFLSYCKVASEPSFNKKSSLENFMSQSQTAPKEQYEVSPKEQSSEEITIIEPVSIKAEPIDIDLDLDLQASELTECPQPHEQKTGGRESSQAHRVVVTFDAPNKRYRMQNLLNERHTATQAVSRNITDDTRFQFDDCNQFKETDAKRLTNQAYSSANFELLQKSPFLTTSSVVGSCKVSDQKDQLDMFSFCQAETPQDTHLYRSIAGKSEHLGNRKAAGLSSAKLQFDTKALKLCDYPENVRQTTDVFDKTNARGASVESKPADMQQHTEAPSILHRHHRVSAFVDNGIYHPSGSTSEVENQRQFDSGIVHYSEPGSEKSGSSMLMNSQVNIGFEEGRNETQQYRFGQRIFTEETAFTESEQSLKCLVCHKLMKNKSPYYRKKHWRIHIGCKPYVCEICGWKFSDPSNLTKHKRKHTEKSSLL